MKKTITAFILGIVLTSIIGVVAYSYNAKDISYTPSDDNWKVNNISDAIDSIKQTGTYKKVCELKSGNALEIGSKYECNPSLDGETKYNFYVLKNETNLVKLIMERNITDTVGSYKMMNWNSAMDFFRNGSGTSLNWKVPVDLPSAQDIADAVGNTSWKVAEKDYSGWFCLVTKAKDYNGNPWCGNGSSINYLIDYTKECSSWGCSHSLDSTYAAGYWTRDLAIKSHNTTANAWIVLVAGNLLSVNITEATYGVRPVITISKKNIK